MNEEATEIIKEENPPEEEQTVSVSEVARSNFGMWIGLLILLIPLAVYIYCLCPTVFVGDAGDFITAAYTLGVPHPPGYPIYTVLGKVFTELPIPGGVSSVAYRMNMMSAVSAWLACVFAFLFLRRIVKYNWIAIAGALALAFSRQFWEHAEIAEVYTMEIMFLMLVMYLAVLYVQEKKIGWAYLLALTMGLSLAHHYSLLLFYPGILIFAGMNGGLRLRWTSWVLLIVLGLIGLTPYAYLPLTDYKTPLGKVEFVDSAEEASQLPLDVVAVTDSPLQYFWDYFSRAHYNKSRVYTHSEDVLVDRTTTPMVLKKWFETTEEDFGYPMMLFGLLGWIAAITSLFKRRLFNKGDPGIPTAPFVVPILGFAFYWLVVHFYPSGDILGAPLENIDVVIPPLLIPLQASLALIIALGIAFTLNLIRNYITTSGEKSVESSQKYRTFAGLLAISVFALITVSAVNSLEYGDKSRSVISYYYTLNVLDSCDEDSILITTGDETFLFWYAQNCEPSEDPNNPGMGYRRDVWATNWIHNLPSLDILTDEPLAMTLIMERFIQSSRYYTPYLEYLNANYEANLQPVLPYYGDGPINTTFIPGKFSESVMIMGLDVILNGLTYQFRLPGDVPDPATNPDIRQRGALDPIESGAEPLYVIDYFDGGDFDNYMWDGIPRFEGLGDDLSTLATANYYHVNLEAQEREVLGRYQDSLYRFGIQALLEGTPEGSQEAISYLFRCVSLDPDSWFGWNELGDAYFQTGNLQAAHDAYVQLVEISIALGDVDPGYEAHAHSQIAQIILITSNGLSPDERDQALEDSKDEANIALLLDPDNQMARAVLDEIDNIRAGVYDTDDGSSSVVEPEDSISPPDSGYGSQSAGETEEIELLNRLGE